MLAAAVAVAIAAWLRPGGDAAAIRDRLDGLAQEINGGLTDEGAALARAQQIGDYFDPDVTIELGRGSAPIEGRDRVIDMAARLQPRTNRFTIRFTDVSVTMTSPATATAEFTAEFVPRAGTGGTLDAREFSATLVRSEGEWRIATVEAVEALR